LDIHDITRQVDRRSGPELPGHVARLFDARGREIAHVPVHTLGLAWPAASDASGQGGAEWMRFRVSLPVHADAVRLVIQEGDKVRAQLEASGKLAPQTGLQWAHAADDAMTLSWPAQQGSLLAE